MGNNMDNSVKRKILHFFFPNRCPVCGEVIYANDSFCAKCLSKLNYFDDDFSIEGAALFTAVYAYDKEITPAVMLMKNGILGNSSYALGKALGEKLKENGTAVKIDLIIPVPMYKTDQRKRGYNQAEYICREISRIISKPVRTGIIIKNRKTASQKTLGKDERMTNLKGVFSVADKEAVKGKSILLADDVCTTGSTLAELTKILLDAGAKNVYCAACCKTLKKNE